MPNLATIYGRGGAPFTVNSEYAQKWQDFINDPEWGDYSFDPKQSGGYNYRNIAGTNTLSQHAHGNAIDINWLANARGTPGNIDPALARRLAQKHGLTWGGDWRNPDPMHFEIAAPGGPKAPMPQPPDGMDAVTYGAAPSPTTTGSISARGRAMPDPVTGEYTPEEIIAARRRQAGLYQAEAVPGGKWGPLAGLLQGVGSGVTGNQADTYSRGNQKMLQDALRGAAGAPDVGRYLLNSGVPALQGQGMSALIAEQQRLAEQNTPAAKLAQETNEFKLANSRQNAPLERQKTEAEIKALGTKDAEKEAAAAVLRGIMQEQPPQAAPAAPGYQPIPPGGPRLQPQSGEIAPGDPNLIKTQAAPGQPAPAAQPEQDTVSAFGRKIPRDKARQYGEALLAIPGKEALGKHLLELAGQGAGTLSKPAMHDIDKAELGFTNMLSSFKEIDRLYDPKFLQGSPKISYALNNIRDKWAPDTWAKMKLDPKETEDLRKYEQFGATAMNNLNTRLKELSGTAVTESEMNRILRELPSPGTGPFSGDGPVAFKAKLDQGRRMAQMAVARMRYLRTKGFTGDVAEASSMIPIDNMPSMIQQRGDQFQKMIEQQMPGADPNAIKIKVKEALANEFGRDI